MRTLSNLYLDVKLGKVRSTKRALLLDGDYRRKLVQFNDDDTVLVDIEDSRLIDVGDYVMLYQIPTRISGMRLDIDGTGYVKLGDKGYKVDDLIFYKDYSYSCMSVTTKDDTEEVNW